MIMETENIFNEKMVAYLGMIAREGINNAARGFSGLLGQNLSVTEPVMKIIPLLDIARMIGGPEDEAVGIYLRAVGDLTSQFMLVIELDRAISLADLLLDQPEGTTTFLGQLERSALAEVGNMTATFFMNSVASVANIDIRPTPPAVMVDMVGAIMDVIIATAGSISDHVLVLNSKFELNHREVEIDFWVIPDEQTLKLLSARI
jgi:chemotaxis protein CheC